MPSWFGNALGAFIGLLAILLGALYNARLNRLRDDERMQEEAKSIAAAIGAEMAITAEMTCGRLAQAASGPVGRTAAALNMLVAPQPVVWPRLAERIGLLDADLARDTVKCWMLLDWHAQLLAATVDDMRAGAWSEVVALDRCSLVKDDLPVICATVGRLTGAPAPDLQYVLP